MNIKKLSAIDNLPEALKTAEEVYAYQKNLTNELDHYTEDFDYLHLLKIVLWKLNRFPAIDNEIIISLNDLKTDFSESKANVLLISLLNIKGIDLPIASTILRFLRPDEFQIIDQRAYRILYGEELKLPVSKESKAKLYIDYLKELRKQCECFKIEFQKADRLLYSLDKIINKEIKLKKYGGNI